MNGTKLTELDVESLYAIIDKCIQSGVTKMKVGVIEFTLDPHHKARQETTALQNDPYQKYASPDSEQPPTQPRSAFEKDLLKDLNRAQLMIDDPVGFERDVVDQFLRGEDYAGQEVEN